MRRKYTFTTFLILTIIAFGSPLPAVSGNLHFDHALYGEILNEFLKEGRVDYRELKKNPAPLNGYLEKVGELSPQVFNSLSRNEEIAFYINAYNALTLKAIIDHYPLKSIKEIPGVWSRLKWKVIQKELTLDDIEHRILRRIYREPRIHFALVCASKGCAELASRPFGGEDLDEQLSRAARKFIADKKKARLDKEKNTLYLSSLFKWFRKDFGNLLSFISDYIEKEEAVFIRNKKPRIKYLKYDWSLNERSAGE